MSWRVLQALVVVALLAVMGCGETILDWSPDGSRVVVQWPRDSQTTVLRVVNVTTGAFRTLPGSSDAGVPAWSPDGRFIAFARHSAHSRPTVCLYDVEAGSTQELLKDAHGPLVWREDSARLLAFRSDPDRAVSLTVPDGYLTWEAQLPGSVLEDNAGCAWVPNTDNIIVNVGNDLWIIEGAEATRLTTTGDVIGMRLSTDGARLTWARTCKASDLAPFTLYSMSLKERSGQRLPLPLPMGRICTHRNKERPDTFPVVIDPNSRRLVVGLKWTGRRTFHAHLVAMRLDGSDQRAVATIGPDEFAISPSFSPAGRRLAFIVGSKNRIRLVVANADGTGCRTVMRGIISGR